MRWGRATLVIGLVCGVTQPAALAAQAPVVSPSVDRAIARARAAVDAGDGAEARAVLDSLEKAAPVASNDLAEILFWRATLSERLSDAERDWKRLVIDVPLAPRASDALLRLGELEMLRGHPAGARTYFARVAREFPAASTRARSQLWIAKSYVAQRDLPRACVALAEASAAGMPDGELKLQAEEMGRQCATVDRTLIAKVMSDTVAPAIASAKVVGSDAAKPAKPTPKLADVPKGARFSVQLAAFDTAEEAERLVKRLRTRGIEARIDGTAKPFRVRVGYFDTRAAAKAEQAKLKQRGQSGYIAEITK
jgi:cell division septation protein DedD